jgi:hypothetical protein
VNLIADPFRWTTQLKEDHMKTIWACLKTAYGKPIAPIAIGLMVTLLGWGWFALFAIPLRARIAAVATPARLNDLWYIDIPITSALLGFAVGFATWFVRRAMLANRTRQAMPRIAANPSAGHSQSTSKSDSDSGTEFLLKAVVPVAAAAFFFYQVIAGSYFAGTTVTVQGTRCGDKILVSVTLERGDNWLVNIPADEYHVGPVGTGDDFDSGWKSIGFQRKRYGDLRLAPKEKTTTMFFVEPTDARSDTIIVVAIDSYAKYWPMPSQSFAKLIIPAVANKDDSLKCIVVSNAKETST